MAATEDLDALGILVGFGSRRIKDDNELRVDFGGNYSQRAADGINSSRQKWNIVWDNLTSANLITLMDFLEALGSHIAFLWTPPRQSTPLQWTIERGTLSEDPQEFMTSTVRVRFIQEFDL